MRISLIHYLLYLDIVIIGTTRKDLPEMPQLLTDIKAAEGGIRLHKIVQRIVNRTLYFAWQDNKTMLGMTTAYSLHRESDFILKDRKKPRGSSSAAKIARKSFRTQAVKEIRIPRAIDDYNHGKGYID